MEKLAILFTMFDQNQKVTIFDLNETFESSDAVRRIADTVYDQMTNGWFKIIFIFIFSNCFLFLFDHCTRFMLEKETLRFLFVFIHSIAINWNILM